MAFVQRTALLLVCLVCAGAQTWEMNDEGRHLNEEEGSYGEGSYGDGISTPVPTPENTSITPTPNPLPTASPTAPPTSVKKPPVANPKFTVPVSTTVTLEMPPTEEGKEKVRKQVVEQVLWTAAGHFAVDQSNVREVSSAWARRLATTGSINVEYEIESADSADAQKVADSAKKLEQDPSQQQKFVDTLKFALKENVPDFPAGSLATLDATVSAANSKVETVKVTPPPPSTKKKNDGFIPDLSQEASIGVVIAAIVVGVCLCGVIKSKTSGDGSSPSDQKGNYGKATQGSSEMSNYNHPARQSSEMTQNAGPEFTV